MRSHVHGIYTSSFMYIYSPRVWAPKCMIYILRRVESYVYIHTLSSYLTAHGLLCVYMASLRIHVRRLHSCVPYIARIWLSISESFPYLVTARSSKTADPFLVTARLKQPSFYLFVDFSLSLLQIPIIGLEAEDRQSINTKGYTFHHCRVFKESVHPLPPILIGLEEEDI